MGILKLFTPKRLSRQSDLPEIHQHPLIRFSPQDAFTIGDSLEHVLITGETGSGKTSGSGQTLALAMLRAGYGGLVLTHKSDETIRWIDYAEKTGRMKDIILVAPDTNWRFNFLDYGYTRGGGSLTENVVAAFMNVMESRGRGGQRNSKEDFWQENAGRHLFYGLEALRHARQEISMDNLMSVLTTAPIGSKDGVSYRQGSYCERILQHAPPQITHYFENEWAAPGADRQNAGIMATLTGMAHPFTQNPIRELFCTSTNFTPDDSREGAIIIIDLPVLEYEGVGRTCQLLFKYMWQRAMLRYQGFGHRPVFLWCDEAQVHTTSFDTGFLEAARSSMAAAVYLTQSVNAIYTAMPSGTHEQHGNALLANFSTKIFHRNSDHVTNRYASDTISKGIVIRYNGGTGISTNSSHTKSKGYSESYGGSSSWSNTGSGGGSSWSTGYNESKSSTYGGGVSSNQGWSEQDDYLVRPEIFTHLASGGPRSNFKVQAIVYKAGRHWRRTGQNYIDVSFRQR